ncbi:MAG: trigger factor [Oscillospiraceae bacterium]|nr:trigger factor [Oscillospiraceae bacterium]
MSFVYRGLKATLNRHIVTDAEIDRQMERLQQQYPRIAIVKDRPTQSGDEVVLDYAGFCDGEQFAGGTAEKQTLVLGSGTFIPGFEEQLLDKVPGEKVSVHVTFPEHYHSADLAGKAAEFKCVIHEIRVKTAYELDDVFAKEVGGCETFGQMRERLGESLQNYSNERGEMDLQDRLLRQAAETLEFSPTGQQLEAELDNQMNNLKAQLAQQGLSIDMYCSFMNTTEAQLREDARADAEVSVRMQAAIEQIVSLENLEATKEEIAEAVAVIARQNNMTLEQLKPYYDAEFEAAVVRSVLTGKVMSLIRESAEITEA